MPIKNAPQALRAPLTFSKRLERKWFMLLRIIKSGCINFVRNAWLSIAAIAMMVITLTIVLFSIILNQTFRHTVQQITDKIDVSVYLKDEVTPVQRDDFIASLRRQKNVKEVVYLSKDDALKVYQEQNKENTELLTAISQTDNPLPASLQIKPKDVNDLQSIRDFVSTPDNKALQSDEADDSGDRKSAVDKITKTARFFGQIGAIAVLVFAVVSVLIIFNTIQMAIFNRRDELAIMQLLGASPGYIRGPFLIEALLYGIISGLISLLICNLILQVQASVFRAGSSGVIDIAYTIEFLSMNFGKLLITQLGLGIGIAVLSANVATRRHLRKSRPKKK